ncbi:MAG TPA: hypothetical protein VF881_17950 [Polyangiaceae bacterium]
MDTQAYVCTTCFRRCVHVRANDEARPRCVCGSELEEAHFPPGLYEVFGPIVAPAQVAEGAERAEEPAKPISEEADIGYGASHGYAPGHGGPTGPGDAPAQ